MIPSHSTTALLSFSKGAAISRKTINETMVRGSSKDEHLQINGKMSQWFGLRMKLKQQVNTEGITQGELISEAGRA